MPDRDSYTPGTPNWIDLQTSDQDAAKTFYSSLFGWEYDDLPGGPGGAIYSMAMLRGKQAAAIATLPPGQGAPPHWNSYVAVEDADKSAATATDAGGTVVMPPMDVMDAGRMAVVQDPTGAFILLWQAKENIGAQVVNEPGAWTWTELSTGDVNQATAFYGTVFGWTPTPFGDDYTLLENDGTAVAGAMKSPAPGMSPFWLVYFEVADTDATVAEINELGGSVMADPMDIPDVGRLAVVSDPQGAAFGVVKSVPQA